MTAQTYVNRGRQTLRRMASDKRLRTIGKGAAWSLGGFLMSAASLSHSPVPLAMGLICGTGGWQAALTAAGSVLGYRVFWGSVGEQGVVWALLGCMAALALGRRKISEDAPLLIPAVCALLVSGTGLAFLFLRSDQTPVPIYLLRVGLGAGSAWLFGRVLRGRDAVTDWLAQAVAVLALAQVAPTPWLCLGYLAAAAVSVGEALPAAALAGVALDLAGVTAVPMTAVMCLAFLARLIPQQSKWLRWSAAGLGYILVMAFTGTLDLTPLPMLILGSVLGTRLPGREPLTHRRGETGLAQVRLELTAGVLSQTQQLLLETQEAPIDESVLLLKAQERACGGCPNRKLCRDVKIPADSLRKPFLELHELGFACRKPGRMVLELRRSQEQLRNLKADRRRQQQYREAVVQQYQFLAEYLRQLSDELPRKNDLPRQHYRAEVAVCAAGKESANGDRCIFFSGTACRSYLLLCDGMGTGLGAAQEGQAAAGMLRQLLSAGFPAQYALRSLNSLTVLRGRAGAVTVDLAEISLDTGKATLYKWGAAPSWLLRDSGAEKIGTAGPPPGLSVTEARETVERLSLRRGETLILVSDGVDGEGVLRRLAVGPGEPPGELAARLLEQGAAEGADDATAAVIRLHPTRLST